MSFKTKRTSKTDTDLSLSNSEWIPARRAIDILRDIISGVRMKLQRISGITFFVAGAAIMPFGYWLNKIYYAVGLLVAFIGGILLAKYLLTKSQEDPAPATANNDHPPVIGDAAGFHGARNIDDHADTADEDDID